MVAAISYEISDKQVQAVHSKQTIMEMENLMTFVKANFYDIVILPDEDKFERIIAFAKKIRKP